MIARVRGERPETTRGGDLEGRIIIQTNTQIAEGPKGTGISWLAPEHRRVLRQHYLSINIRMQYLLEKLVGREGGPPHVPIE